MAELDRPAPLAGWRAWCENCGAAREFGLHQGTESRTLRTVYEYVCESCASVLLTLTPPGV